MPSARFRGCSTITPASARPAGAAGRRGKAASAAELIADRIYPGVDLTVVYAAEIAGYSDVWAWIKARAQAAKKTEQAAE